jgi:hydroxyacylglutathione hydrolase
MKVIQVPLLTDNYGYLLVCEETNEAAIVDPSEGAPVFERVKTENLKLTTILNTHHHWDHTGGNTFLLSLLSLKVHGHRIDQERIPGLTHPLEEGDEVQVGKLRGKVFFIPGHTKGHIAYLFDHKLFCGDTLFVAGCGRLFEGTAEQMFHSLSKLRELPADTLVYCGHEYTEKNLQFALTLEPNNAKIAEKLSRVRRLRAQGISTVPSTIKEESETNPFLRWDSQEIWANLQRRYPELTEDPLAVFSQVRKLKDHF